MCIGKLRGIKAHTEKLSLQSSNNGPKKMDIQPIMRFDGYSYHGNSKNNSHKLVCTPISVVNENSQQKPNAPTKRFMCKRHKIGSLSTYENHHYMGIDMEYIGKYASIV